MEGTTTTTGISTVLSGVDTLSTLVSKVFDLMVANPVLLVLLAGALIGAGIAIFRKLRSAAR